MLLAGTSTVPALRLPSTPSYSLPLGADLMVRLAALYYVFPSTNHYLK